VESTYTWVVPLYKMLTVEMCWYNALVSILLFHIEFYRNY